VAKALLDPDGKNDSPNRKHISTKSGDNKEFLGGGLKAPALGGGKKFAPGALGGFGGVLDPP